MRGSRSNEKTEWRRDEKKERTINGEDQDEEDQ